MGTLKEPSSQIRRALWRWIPGSAAHTAEEKKRLERALRAEGYSRKGALIEVSKRYPRNE